MRQMVQVAVFSSHEEAARIDREQAWALTPQQRLAQLEELRRIMYPNGVAPRLSRTAEFVEPARR